MFASSASGSPLSAFSNLVVCAQLMFVNCDKTLLANLQVGVVGEAGHPLRHWSFVVDVLRLAVVRLRRKAPDVTPGLLRKQTGQLRRERERAENNARVCGGVTIKGARAQERLDFRVFFHSVMELHRPSLGLYLLAKTAARASEASLVAHTAALAN